VVAVSFNKIHTGRGPRSSADGSGGAENPVAKNVGGIGIDELFLQEPNSIGMTARAPHQSWGWFSAIPWTGQRGCGDRAPVSKKLRARAIDSAIASSKSG